MVDRRTPDVSFVVPAKNEARYLGATLESVHRLRTDLDYEVLVVDGDSQDATVDVARGHDATVIEGHGDGIGPDRNLGARHADGDWLAFVDADTVVRPSYLSSMLGFVRTNDLVAASSYCRLRGPRRAKLMEVTINHVFARLGRPILPGFNFFVGREPFAAIGGFPDVPNEDTALSRALGRIAPTGYCPRVLVDTSGRRIANSGLTGTLWHYLRLDVERLRASTSPPFENSS